MPITVQDFNRDDIVLGDEDIKKYNIYFPLSNSGTQVQFYVYSTCFIQCQFDRFKSSFDLSCYIS